MSSLGKSHTPLPQDPFIQSCIFSFHLSTAHWKELLPGAWHSTVSSVKADTRKSGGKWGEVMHTHTRTHTCTHTQRTHGSLFSLILPGCRTPWQLRTKNILNFCFLSTRKKSWSLSGWKDLSPGCPDLGVSLLTGPQNSKDSLPLMHYMNTL